MSSLTLKGKPSDNAPVSSVSSTALPPASANAGSGMTDDRSLGYFKYDLLLCIPLSM